MDTRVIRTLITGVCFLAATAIVVEGQVGPGALANLPGIVDANNALLVSLGAADLSEQVGPRAIANLPGVVDENGALLVAIDGDITTDETVDAGGFAVGGVAGYTGTIEVMGSDGVLPVTITVVGGIITDVQ